MNQANIDYFEFIMDQLHGLPNIRSRRMFGAYGLYQGEYFFGIVSGAVFYLKTNDVTRGKFIEAGMDCFRPSEKQVLKNYYEVPEMIIENPDELSEWVLDAVDVARGADH